MKKIIAEHYHHESKRLYWNNQKCDWGFKDDVIRTKITKSLRPIIDKIMEENKDFINFFL